MREANRANWDARTPVHVAGAFYDLGGLRAGADPLADFEWQHLGDLSGRDVVHLQCHIGSDTVPLARAGARVRGVDISGESVAAARELAAECGADIEYVRSDVYDAREALAGELFDVVYTGKGALCWLPDLERWARVVAGLLRPGGSLCLVEFHPVLGAAADRQPDVNAGLWLDYDYHGGALIAEETPVTYTGDAITGDLATYEWPHGLGEVINAVIGAGLRIDALDERDATPWTPWSGMTPVGSWGRLPEGAPRMPLVYALRATLPE